ncbi:MAG TPA: rod shape-determining protein MreD [Gemmatimonadales bacterium]
MIRRSDRYRLGAVIAMLVVLHFVLRGWLGDPGWAPDLLFLALLVYAIRARPGSAAVAGFVMGLLGDALTPVAFGSGALASTGVGYLAAWGKAVFFADNLLVNAGFFFAGTWARDLLVLLAGGQVRGIALFWQLVWFSVLKAFTTAVAGVLVLVSFRGWLQVKTGE